MANFLVFAGTSEGRRLIEYLDRCGASVCACVATEYGKTLLPESVRVFAQRLDAQEMTTLLQTLRFDCVIDATHPYAAVVTGNIREACEATATRCLRLMRPQSKSDGCVYVETAAHAAEVLTATTGKVLLTTGSKDLDMFTHVPDFQSRIYPRVLPTLDSIQRCLALGYQIQNIIAMQGPFTRELNSALMRQTGAAILVTKESGDAGGFSEKLDAAIDAGATAIVIGRPHEDNGLTYEEVAEILKQDYELYAPLEQTENIPPRFPLFISLDGRRVGIFGGGTVATRRAAVLTQFGCSLTVISPRSEAELEHLGAQLIHRPYQHGDCGAYDYIIAATDNRDVNHAIAEEARMAGIPVNVSDAPEECDFYFPAIIRRDDIVIGVTASGSDHKLVRKTAQNIRERAGDLIPEGEQGK